MRYLLCLILAATSVSAIHVTDVRRLALQNPDLFQGDILGIDPHDRNVMPFESMRWPKGIVPYVLDDDTVQGKVTTIQNAMHDYHRKTCIRFVPRTTEENYIRIFSGAGCYSYVGMVNGPQDLSLSYGCMYKGTIIHELGHALGFYHEHSRSDRDQYLTIYWDNIFKGMEDQFRRLNPEENLLLTPFDHDSIMIYGEYVFSKDGKKPTMMAKNNQILLEPYDKDGLSSSDVKRLKIMYDC